MTLRYAPPELKAFIEQRWLYDDKNNIRDWGQYKDDIYGFINYMKQPGVDEETFKYFFAKNIALDKFRKEDLFTVVPEYEPFLNKYVTEPTEAYSVSNTIPIVHVDEIEQARKADPFIYD